MYNMYAYLHQLQKRNQGLKAHHIRKAIEVGIISDLFQNGLPLSPHFPCAVVDVTRLSLLGLPISCKGTPEPLACPQSPSSLLPSRLSSSLLLTCILSSIMINFLL